MLEPPVPVHDHVHHVVRAVTRVALPPEHKFVLGALVYERVCDEPHTPAVPVFTRVVVHPEPLHVVHDTCVQEEPLSANHCWHHAHALSLNELIGSHVSVA